MADPRRVDIFQQMTTFVRIADAGSISKAARSLRLSVAMASRQLSALEEELGAPLMRRTTRRIDLTEAGEELLMRARALLADLDEAREAVRPGSGVAGLLIMSLPVSLGLAQLTPLFPPFLEKHPRLKLELRFEDHGVDLLAEGVDIAIRAGLPPPDSPFIVMRRLATFERVLCAAPSLLRRTGPVDSVEALRRLPCVMLGAAPTRWSFETPGGLTTVDVDGCVRTNNMLAVREAAIAGVGVAQLSLWMVADDLRRRRLVRILEGARLPTTEVFALFHRGSRGSTKIRALLDYLAAELPRRVSAKTPR